MKNYPHLAEMGVLNPQQIESYSVNSIGYTDVLRIVCERPKGSLLPATRAYKFLRVQKAGKDEDVVERNPAFRAAVDDLQDILGAKGTRQDVAGAIAKELRLLEEDIALRSDCIRTLLSKMQSR